MSKICLFLVIIIINTLNLFSSEDEILISERVGNLIDSTERNYFNLFRHFDGFIDAKEIKMGDKYYFKIRYTDTSGVIADSLVLLKPYANTSFSRYIDNYELLQWYYLKGMDEFMNYLKSIDLKIYTINHFIKLNVFIDDGDNLKVSLRNGGKINNILLYAGSDYLAFWPDPEKPYTEKNIKKYAIIVPYQNIGTMDYATTTFINGNKTAFEDKLDYLKRIDGITNEKNIDNGKFGIIKILNDMAKDIDRTNFPEPDEISEVRNKRFNDYFISFDATDMNNFSFNKFDFCTTSNIYQGCKKYFKDYEVYESLIKMEITGMKILNNDFSFGAGLFFAKSRYAGDYGVDENGIGIDLLINYNIKNIIPFYSGILNQSELISQIGVEIFKSAFGSQILYYGWRSMDFNYQILKSDLNSTSIGFLVKLLYAYRFSDALSLNAFINYQIFPFNESITVKKSWYTRKYEFHFDNIQTRLNAFGFGLGTNYYF